MGLEKYWEKRDFGKTPEPRGKTVKPGRELSYYIQEHHASRLHYDFRLELDGTLKSWAVPKGPSLDPADKRLAVHVEDHPLEYGTFEGDIPEHQYGAGHVMLWDRGTWQPEGDPREGYAKGRLKFHLDGRKLHGGWTLVRMHGQDNDKDRDKGKDNWLLIKEHDEEAKPGEAGHVTEYMTESVADQPRPGARKKSAATAKARKPPATKAAGKPAGVKKKPEPARLELNLSQLDGAVKAPLPDFVSPQLATLSEHAPAGEDWLSEVKFDGYRAVSRIARREARLYTRSGNDWTGKWQQIADALASLPVDQAWLDGEVVALDESGLVSFQALQNMMRRGRNARLAYYVFDLMHLDGYDLARVPLVERKHLLQQLMQSAAGGGILLYSDHVVGGAQEVWEHACMHELEGIVVKRADAGYQQFRSRAWLKVKCMQRQEFVIAGYTDPGGSRDAFGALLLGVYEGEGGLKYAGRVGTGFNAELLKSLMRQFRPLEQARPAFHNPPTGREAQGVHWLRPSLVAEVDFAQWTEAGLIRHASFVALRSDKPPTEIAREKPLSDAELAQLEQAAEQGVPADQAASAKPGRQHQPSRTKKTANPAVEPAREPGGGNRVAGVALSHPAKILYPRIGLTKLGLAEYYEAVGEWLLPHLKERPLVLVRCPQGGEHKCFFQKHVNETIPEAIERIEVPEGDGSATYMMANSLSAVIGLVQMGVLELHTWGSRRGSLDRPDRMIFDLDPDEALPWERMIAAAQLVHGLLDEIGLKSFLKTTGGKGLHIVVPLKPERPWDEVKAFSRAIAEHLAQTFPDRFTANMAKSKRAGRIFIDYLRNGLGATAVAAFSTRAKPEATVSVPVFWEELGPELRADSFKVGNLRQRLAALKEDPWKDYFRLRQRIPSATLHLFD